MDTKDLPLNASPSLSDTAIQNKADGTLTQKVTWQSILSLFNINSPYLKYVALISQSSTNAPSVTILENTIGSIVWTRSSAGVYKGTLAGQLTVTKTAFFISQSQPNGINELWQTIVYNGDDDSITIATQKITTVPAVTYGDNILGQGGGIPATIEIRVYP